MKNVKWKIDDSKWQLKIANSESQKMKQEHIVKNKIKIDF